MNHPERQSWGAQAYEVETPEGEPFTVTVTGRTRWALEALSAAGPRGTTPIETPGPRWSDYVHKLRHLGIPITTEHEPHGGPFPGTHARYRLAAAVRKVRKVAA